jgi:hypothetical protein
MFPQVAARLFTWTLHWKKPSRGKYSHKKILQDNKKGEILSEWISCKTEKRMDRLF